MGEIYRCSNKYIMGFEYYSEKVTALNYRNHNGFMWKADYCQVYQDKFSDLIVEKKNFHKYITEENKGNVDCMFLLKKIKS